MSYFNYKFLEFSNGNIPFIKFLETLNDIEISEINAKIDVLIDWLNNNKTPPQSISKHLRNGIFELKVKHSNRISRSLFFYYDGEIIIFTNGFIKKTNKTPDEEIEKAIKYMKSFKLEQK